MIILGCDHGGFELKERIKKYLLKLKHDIVDVGAFTFDKDDDFSKKVLLMRSAFDKNNSAKIIAICKSGVGMCIGLNKHKGIRCALLDNSFAVELARAHNNINALALSGENTSFVKAKKMIDAFLKTKELPGKYQKRMKEIEIK